VWNGVKSESRLKNPALRSSQGYFMNGELAGLLLKIPMPSESILPRGFGMHTALSRSTWSEVKSLLTDPDKLVSAVKGKIPTDEDSKKEIERLKKQLADTEKGMTQLIDLIASGIVELDGKIKQKLTQLKQRKEVLDRRIKEVKKDSGLAGLSRQEIKDLKHLASEIIENIDNLEFEEKQQLVRSMVSQVYISGRIQGTNHRPDDLPGVDVKIMLRAEMVYSLKNLATS
jgi:DNA repair exonuclease SbcCD ATPase subunit